MSYITWFLSLIGFFALRTVTVDGYSRECDFNQTIFTPEGTTATFLYNSIETFFFDMRIEKTSGSNKGYLVYFDVTDTSKIHIWHRHVVWKNRSNISIPSYSDDQVTLKIDLNNVSMADNGTYRISGGYHACYILYVMRTKIEPRHSQEEHEPIYVFVHPQASLIKRPLTKATMIWLLDGKSFEQTSSFIQQDGRIWIPRIRRDLNGRNVTYRAIQDDGRITEVNTTIKVRYGPIASHPLKMMPSKTHYNMMSGDTMPAIICTSECNPPCNVSWGEHSKDNILNIGAVNTEDTGEYTCTAKRSDGRVVEQTVSVFVSDNSNFIIAIACLASVQAFMILGLCTFVIYKRKDSSCCHVQCNSKNKTDSRDVALQLSSVQGSENATYEELKHETRNTVNNVYSETNLSTIEDRAVGMTYENTSISG